MILYAPAALRRWRGWLVLPLLAIGVLAFGTLLVLPGFEQAPAQHGAAILAGIFAWTLLVFLMNGEPLRSKSPFEAPISSREPPSMYRWTSLARGWGPDFVCQ